METLDERKNKIVEKLSSEYSLNHISLEEYERLIQYSHNIETEKEFRILEKIIEENKSPQMSDNSKTALNNIEREYFTVLSSRQTSGPITNGNFITVLGSHQIFLKEEDLINKETVLNVTVLLGEIVISVPDNVEVINNAIPLLANVSINESAETGGTGKRLIVRGNVILGEIKIYIKRH
jgi:predicted membrane protein